MSVNDFYQSDIELDYGEKAGTRPFPEIFSLQGDMSDVERNYLADLLDADVLSGYSVQNISRQLEIIDRFRKCGQQGSSRICPNCMNRFYSRFYCKARLCDVCSRIYGQQVSKKILELIKPCFSKRKKGWTIALLTLSTSTGKYRGRFPTKEDTKVFNSHVGSFCRLFYGKHAGRFSRTGKVVEDRKPAVFGCDESYDRTAW